MPHIWNDILVVTKEELIPTFWNSYNNLANELWRYKNLPYGIKRASVGGNGRQLLVRFDSLPAHIQAAIGDPTKADHPLEKIYKTDPEAVEFYVTYERPGIGALKPNEQEKYIINASMIRSIFELEQQRTAIRIRMGGTIRGGKNTKSVAQSLFDDAHSFQEYLESQHGVRHTLPTNQRRFKDALKAFQNDGYISVIKDPFGKSFQNAKKVTDETIQLLNNLFATQSHKPTATEIARQYESFLAGYIEIINNSTGELYQPSDFKPLSQSTIKSYLAQWENRIATYSKRSGNRQKFLTQFIPHHRMERTKFAGSIISIDDRQPPFKYPSGKSGKRMWFYIGIDLASEAITTWVSGKTKEGIILEFYRQMIRNYHDWGVNLPYELECESSLNSMFKDTLLKEGVMFQGVRIEANKARSKKIERYFGELRYRYEKKREGWIARPHAQSESNQLSSEKAPLLPYERITDECIQDIVTWNNSEHGSEKGESRWDYFMKNQHPDLKPANYRAILPHLGHHTESSCNAGMINFRSTQYLIAQEGKVASGEGLIDCMKSIEGKEIDIYWLDANDGSVLKALIFHDNRFICETLPVPMSSRSTLERTEAHREARTIMARYERTVTEFLKTQKGKIDSVTLIDRTPKVINNNFQVPGFSAPKRTTNINTDIEILDDLEEVHPIIIEENTTTRRSLSDRF